MRFRLYLLLILILTIFVNNCSQESSYIIPETLFSEIVNADDPMDSRVLENNWLAFDELGEAYKNKGDLLKARAVFTTFFTQNFNLDENEFGTSQYDVLIEFGANLLKATPDGGILIVYFDEVYYLALFANKVLGIRPETPVVWAKATPTEKYREYLNTQYNIIIPPIKNAFEEPSKREYEETIQDNCEWMVESLGKPIYFSPSAPYSIRPFSGNVSLGPGVLYNIDKTDKERLETEIELIKEVLVLDAVSDTTIPYPDMVKSLIQWYIDPPLVHAKQELMQGDTASYLKTMDVLIEKFPSMWKPASVYLITHKDIPEEQKSKLLRRIERYLELNPEDRRAKRAFDQVKDNGNKNGVL